MLTEPQIQELLDKAQSERLACKAQLQKLYVEYEPADWDTHRQLRRLETRIETLKEVLEGL